MITKSNETSRGAARSTRALRAEDGSRRSMRARVHESRVERLADSAGAAAASASHSSTLHVLPAPPPARAAARPRSRQRSRQERRADQRAHGGSCEAHSGPPHPGTRRHPPTGCWCCVACGARATCTTLWGDAHGRGGTRGGARAQPRRLAASVPEAP